jgi:glycosyltransferase involved in cell wall biosynthesis
LDINQPILLFVGNYTKTKNMECALLAFKQFMKYYPSARLIITTELPIEKYSDRENYLKKLIEELGVQENLDFRGIIDNMPEVMQLADVLVAPFRDTDGPSDYYLAALEAMATGTPAFVSPVGGMKEVINDSTGRFIDPEQPDQLCDELKKFFSNRSLGYELGKNASTYVRNNFAPELIERKVNDVYQEVLHSENESGKRILF